MTRTEIATTVGTALLSFVGALAGVYAGARFEQANWEARFELEQRKLLLEKRTSLVERVAMLLNKVPLMKGLQGSLQAETDMAKLASQCAIASAGGKPVPRGCKNLPETDMKHVEDLGREIYVMNAEWAAAASLSIMYFGPQTRQSIHELTKVGIWEASDVERQAVLNAMGNEMVQVPK